MLHTLAGYTILFSTLPYFYSISIMSPIPHILF